MIEAVFFVFRILVWLLIIGGAIILLIFATDEENRDPSGVSLLIFVGAPALLLIFKSAELFLGYFVEGLHFFRVLELVLTAVYFSFFAIAFALTKSLMDAVASKLETKKYILYALLTNAFLGFVFLILVGTLRATLFHFDSTSYHLNQGAQAAFRDISATDRRKSILTLQSCKDLERAVNSIYDSASGSHVLQEMRGSTIAVEVTSGSSGRQTEVFEMEESYPFSETNRGPCTIQSSGSMTLRELQSKLNNKIDKLEAYLNEPLIYQTNAITFAFLSTLDIFTIGSVEVEPKSATARALDFFANWMVILLGVLLIDCIEHRNRLRKAESQKCP